MVYIIDKTNKPYRRNYSRRADIEILSKDLKSSDPQMRERAKQSIDRIRKEDGNVTSMREALIKEHRSGNKENIKDIHDYIERREKYKNKP